MSNKNANGKNFLAELALLAISLIGSGYLLKWSMNHLDPNADARKAAKHKKKEIARRLGLEPGSIETNQYEDIISLEVVTHSHLDVQGLRDVGGLEEIKEALHNKVIAPLREPGLFQSSLLRQAKGVLLYGPPGTGKTMLAKALAAESGSCFINVKPSTLQSKWFGETNKLVTAVFTLANKLQPSIIFIDEVDALLGKRRDQEHEAVTAMKTEFMQLWDGFSTDPSSNVMVLAATNRPYDLDEAVLRRFSAQFEVPLPDERQREAILELTLAKHVEEVGQATVERLLRTNTPAPSGRGGGGGATKARRPLAEIAAATHGFSGSDLHELCAAAAAIPVHEFVSSSRNAGARAAAEEEVTPADGNESSSDSSRTKRRAKSPQRSRRPRQLSLVDFHKALRHMRPSGDHAAAYRASSMAGGGGGGVGGHGGGGIFGSVDAAMAALAALAAGAAGGGGAASGGRGGGGGGGGAGQPAGAAA